MSTHHLTFNDLHDHEDIFEKIPDLVFLAEAEKESFEPVQVITLQQYYKEKAYDKAWDMIESKSTEDLDRTAKEICDREYATSKEFVEIQKTRVIIGLNAKTITDREINRAMSLLISIDDFTPGEIYDFGEDRLIHYEFTSQI